MLKSRSLSGVGMPLRQVVPWGLVERRQRPERPSSETAGYLCAKDGIDDAPRVDSGLEAVVVPLSGEREIPEPSIKNGRFSEKNVGKRWFTSTWKASLSTWLKSGLTVASSVIVDVMPYFPLMPTSP